MQLLLEASIRVREGASQEAALLLDQAEESRRRIAGHLRRRGLPRLPRPRRPDLLRLRGAHHQRQYYWIPIARVESIEFHEPERPRDLLWRRTTGRPGGPDGEVYLPVLYPGPPWRPTTSSGSAADRLAGGGRHARPGRRPAHIPGRRGGPADHGAQDHRPSEPPR